MIELDFVKLYEEFDRNEELVGFVCYIMHPHLPIEAKYFPSTSDRQDLCDMAEIANEEIFQDVLLSLHPLNQL